MTTIGGNKTKKFGDKTYHVWHAFSTKERANLEATRLRKDGHLARVVDTAYWYVIYTHGGN
jgi:hypothetical protein